MKLLVIGFPKSGTTSITAALEASGLKPLHWRDRQGRFAGKLIYEKSSPAATRSTAWATMIR